MFRSMLVLILLLLATTVSAQEFNYTFIQGGLVYVDDRATGLDLDDYGGFIGGSFAINSNFHVIGSYQQVDFDAADDFDLTEMSLGIGYNTSISDFVDFVTTLSWIDAEIDKDEGGSDSDDGVRFDVGFRASIFDSLDLNGSFGVAKLSDGDNNTVVSTGLDYYVSNEISVGLSGQWTDNEVASYVLSLRYNFNR